MSIEEKLARGEDLTAEDLATLPAPAGLTAEVVNGGFDAKSNLMLFVEYTDGDYEYHAVMPKLDKGKSVSVTLSETKRGIAKFGLICRLEYMLRMVGRIEADKTAGFKHVRANWTYQSGLEEAVLEGRY